MRRILCSTSVRTAMMPLLAGVLAGTTPFAAAALAVPPQAAASAPPAADPLAGLRADVFAGGARAQAAIPGLEKLLADNPRFAEAHMLLGLARVDEGSHDMLGEAVAEFRQALDLEPGLVPARLYIARVYLDLGQPDRALEEITTALSQMPNQVQFMAVRAEAERRLGHAEQSAETARAALKIDPTFAQARYCLALALLDLKQRAEGIRELEAIVTSGASVPDVYFSLGAAYLEAGRTDSAIGAITDGLRLDPDRAAMRVKLAQAYREKGLLTKADEELTRASTPGTDAQFSAFFQQLDADLHLERGRIRLQQRRFREAAEAFQQSLDASPNSGPAHRYLAEAYWRQGLRAKAASEADLADQFGSPLPTALRQAIGGAAGTARSPRTPPAGRPK